MALGDLKGTLTGNGNSVTNPSDLSGSVAVNVNDLVVVVFGQQTNLTATGVTDNLGNTYTAQNAGTDAGTSTGRAFYSIVTVSGTLTVCHVAASASTNDYAGIAGVFEGPVLAIDKNIANGTDTTSPFNCPATGTLNQNGEIIIAWGTCPTGTTAAWSATSPNLLAGQVNNGTNIKAVLGYQTVSPSTTVTPVFTCGTNPADDTLGTFTFKGALSNFVVVEELPPHPRPKAVDDVTVNLLFRWSIWNTGMWDGAYWSDVRLFPTIYSAPAPPIPEKAWIGQDFPNLHQSTLAKIVQTTGAKVGLGERDLAAAPAIPAKPYDTPNLLASTLAPPSPPAVTYIFRPPLYAPIRERPAPAIVAPYPNLLESTLAPPIVVNTPFILKDFSLPQTPQPSAKDGFVNLLQAELAPFAQKSFTATDTPRPNDPLRPSPDFQNQNLLQSTLGPSAQKLFRATDTPRPADPAQAVRIFDNQNLHQSTLAPVVQKTLIAKDLPLSTPPRPLSPDFINQNLLQSTLAPFAQTIFRAQDLPAAAPPPQIAKDFEPQNLLASTLTPPVGNKPLINYDLSLAPQTVYRAKDSDPQDLLQSTLAGAQAILINRETRLLALVSYGAKDFAAPNLLESTLKTPQPFQINDFALPAAPRSTAPSFDNVNLLESTLRPIISGAPVFILPEIAQPSKPQSAAADFIMQTIFPAPAPPPEVVPQGGHWLPPTPAELARMRRELAAADRKREELWAERLRDQEEMHAAIMAQLHPERVLGIVPPAVAPTTALPDSPDDDDDDIEFLLLNI